jgi:dolichol-phosphate mannosyltransferase
MLGAQPRVAVVIPCFKVKAHILEVINNIEPFVEKIYVVDDCCPQDSGVFVRENCQDQPRVLVLTNTQNMGVGGAVMTGYRQALADGMEIVVKVDGDGQMLGASIANLIRPLVKGLADYSKGNRFYNLTFLRSMPLVRLLGNCGLSFISKLSGGYWNIMDPTNGFTAIRCSILRLLDFDKIEKRYFFESDMLYHLYLLRAVIWDVPMPSRYGSERSNLAVHKVLFEFGLKHWSRFCKRIFYSYFLRDFQIGSLMLLAGICLEGFGVGFGSYRWYWGLRLNEFNATGTIMLAALPSLMGLQLLLTFLNCDLNNVPTRPIHPVLEDKRAIGETRE